MSDQETFMRNCRSCKGENAIHDVVFRKSEVISNEDLNFETTVEVFQCRGCNHLCTHLGRYCSEDYITTDDVYGNEVDVPNPNVLVDVEILEGVLFVKGHSRKKSVDVDTEMEEPKDDFLLAEDLTGWNPDDAGLSSGHEATYGWRRLTADYAEKLLSHMENIHASLPKNLDDERRNRLGLGYVRNACNLKKAGEKKNNIFFYKKVNNSIVAIALGMVGAMDKDNTLPLYIDVVLSSKGHGRPFVEHILRGHWEGFRSAHKGCEKLQITLDSIQNVIGFYELCGMDKGNSDVATNLTRMSKTVSF